MTTPLVAVVDYGMGNLRSVSKALEKAGAHVRVTASPVVVRSAAAVVLPGVGAFGEASRRLVRAGLARAVADALATDKPFLGICLGLQLLFESSEESRDEKGLGYWKGTVRRFRFPARRALKVPHMGWNTLTPGKGRDTRAARTLLRGLDARASFYFVHSFYPAPENASIVATRTDYGGLFCSSAAEGRVFASQFHPEKSGASGGRLLRNFVHEVIQTCS